MGKQYVHVSGRTGPTGPGNELGEGYKWADAELYLVHGDRPLGEQFEKIAVIEVVGKTARECSAKIAKIALEKYGVEIDKCYRRLNHKYEYINGKKIDLGDFKEIWDFVKQKNIIGGGYLVREMTA